MLRFWQCPICTCVLVYICQPCCVSTVLQSFSTFLSISVLYPPSFRLLSASDRKQLSVSIFDFPGPNHPFLLSPIFCMFNQNGFNFMFILMHVYVLETDVKLICGYQTYSCQGPTNWYRLGHRPLSENVLWDQGSVLKNFKKKDCMYKLVYLLLLNNQHIKYG